MHVTTCAQGLLRACCGVCPCDRTVRMDRAYQPRRGESPARSTCMRPNHPLAPLPEFAVVISRMNAVSTDPATALRLPTVCMLVGSFGTASTCVHRRARWEGAGSYKRGPTKPCTIVRVRCRSRVHALSTAPATPPHANACGLLQPRTDVLPSAERVGEVQFMHTHRQAL
jgi:hypothetical protein